MTNTEELRKRIDESGYKICYIAKTLGLTANGFARKLRNESDFKITEVAKLCDVLGISDIEERDRIFFGQ